MLVTDQAKMIRMKVSDMRVIGRNTAGVRLFDVADKEQVVSAALIEAEDDSDEDIGAPDATIASADTPADTASPPAEGQDAD
jgi:DNA gyrase subunit A